ncbi:MAG TPA: lysoplasmalogenase [Steroidobacteraceae bacterium]|nr:lysoplasmalogenase [Steroidobacteraceae bacterium]
MGPGPWILLCALAVAGLLVAERRRSQRGKWIAKPLASVAFVATAIASHALESVYGWLVLLALALCLLGDVLLIPTDRAHVFRAGVFAFLAGHVAYAAAFLTQDTNLTWLAIGAAALVLVLAVVWRWLGPALPDAMRGAVLAYLVVIGAMTALAIGCTGGGGPPTLALGAVAFTASDVSVARDRFVREDFFNRAWGLPLYYCAQLLLALSPAAVAS